MDSSIHHLDHPTDAELLGRVLARETEGTPWHCRRCAERAATIARQLDPLSTESTDLFDDEFYREQADRIRARIAAGDGVRSRAARPAGLHVPRLVWVGGAMAAAVVLAVGLQDGIRILSRSQPEHVDGSITVAANDFADPQDRADDRLLREIDDLVDEDP